MSLSHCTLAPTVCPGLGQCVKLKRFRFSGPTPFSADCALALARLPRLNRVEIGASVGDDDLVALGGSRSIEQLQFYDCLRLTETGFAALRATPLKIIELWQAEDSQLEAVKRVLPDVTIVSKP